MLRLFVRRGIVEADEADGMLGQADGPTAGTEMVDPLEFLARLVTHAHVPACGGAMRILASLLMAR